MKNMVLLFALVLTCLLCPPHAALADPPETEHDAERMYVEAREAYRQKAFNEVVAVMNDLVEFYPESAWYRKARFLKAQVFAEQRQYEKARSIYEQEANRLLSPERKERIARVIVDIADELGRKPDSTDLGAPKPDYPKALQLYEKALNLEIDRALKDELTFKKARTMHRAGDRRAVQALQAYLRQFDPDWTESGQRVLHPPPPGAYRDAARLLLAHAHLNVNQHGQARREAEDYFEQLRRRDQLTPEIAAKLRWFIVQSYQLPTPGHSDLERALGAARGFLEAHPDDPRAVWVAWKLPDTLEKAGRTDEAILGYQAFIDADAFHMSADGAKHPDLDETAAVIYERGRQHALYRMGRLAFEQRRHDNAIAYWERYIQLHPNGPDWSDAHKGILDARYDKAVLALEEKKADAARDLFEAFLRQHPLDARVGDILFLFGQQHYARALELRDQQAPPDAIQNAFREAIAEWKSLLSRFPRSDLASLATYRTGRIQEEEFGDFKAALATYRPLDWGPYAGQARQRVEQMTQKQLTIETERVWRTDETPRVRAQTRNIEKLTVRVWRLDMEAYYRKIHGADQVETLDIELIEPMQTWTVPIEDYGDYVPFTTHLDIPFEGEQSGAVIVSVSDETDWRATTLVIRSDIDIIVKSSLRETLVFAQNMRTDQPAADTRVLFSDGDTVFETGETGEDGVLLLKSDKFAHTDRLRVLAVRDGHIAGHNLDLTHLKRSEGLAPKGYLYTARPAYQPGETVSARGILRDVREGLFAVPDDTPFVIRVRDPQGRTVHQERVALSSFGTFDFSFLLSDNAPVGDYVLHVADDSEEPSASLSFTASFKVRQYRLEKIRLTLDLEQSVYFRGEMAKAEAHAEYYWGQPLRDADVRYTLPDGRTLEGRTDDEGRFSFSFDTMPMSPGTPMSFTVTLVRENITTRKIVPLARAGFTAAIKTNLETVLAGDPFEVFVKTVGADGEPVGKSMTLYVLRRVRPEPNPLLPNEVQSVQRDGSRREAEVTVQELRIETDPATGEARHTLTLEQGGVHILRVAGADRFDQIVTAQSHVHISDETDPVRLRLFAETATINVGEKADARLHARTPAGWALITQEGETILHYDVLRVEAGLNDISFMADHEHFPNMTLTASMMDDRRLHTASQPFTVRRQLNVEVNPLKDHYAPGETGQVELRVTDQLGRPVEAELSLALVDAALLALYPVERPAIHTFFAEDAKRYAEFRTGSSCAFRYEGVTEKIDEGEIAERDRIIREAQAVERRRQEVAELEYSDVVTVAGMVGLDRVGQRAARDGFGMADAGYARSAGTPAPMSVAAPPSLVEEAREEAPDQGYWLPGVVTDTNGVAVVDVPMPEKTTQWRLLSIGCTPDTLVGQAEATTLTRKDFFAAMTAPTFLREGDHMRLVGRVHNLTDRAGPVALTLEIRAGQNGEQLIATRQAKVVVAANADVEAVFRDVEIPAELELHLILAAEFDGLRDVLRQRIPVMPWGMEYADHGGGVSNRDATVLLALPKDQAFRNRWMTVSIGPDAKQSIIDHAIRPSTPRPYVPRPGVGARSALYAETPGDRLLGLAYALQYGRRIGAAAEDLRNLERRAWREATELLATQYNDGGWDWRRHTGNTSRTADWAVTSRAYWALSVAREAGIAVDADMMRKTESWLQNRYRQFSTTDHEAKAVVTHALSASGKADFAHANQLYREHASLNVPALAYTALIFDNMGRAEHARELTDLLLSKRTDGGTHWPADAHHERLKNDTETTALALLCLAKLRPDHPDGHRIAEEFLSGSPATSQAQGAILAALSEWYGDADIERGDFDVVVVVNDHELETIRSRDGLIRTTLPVPADIIKDGENRVEFRKRGAGTFTYAASMYGFSHQFRDPNSWSSPRVISRHAYHENLRYRGRPIAARSTTIIRDLAEGQLTEIRLTLLPDRFNGYLVIEEPLPAGMLLVEDSVKGDYAHYERLGDRLVFYYTPGTYVRSNISYELVGHTPGSWRTPPTILRDAVQPHRMRIGSVAQLTVLDPGHTRTVEYRMNRDELYEMGRLHFEDGLHEKALELLNAHWQSHRNHHEREVARMLLWILTESAYYEPRRVVEMFEVLRSRYPDLEIPFNKILTVGRAYGDIGEHERSWLIYRASIAASYGSDLEVSAILEDAAHFMASVDYQESLWQEYPDSADVVSSYFALTQALYQRAGQAHTLPEIDGVRPDEAGLLGRTARMLTQFLALYADDPLADNAAFSLANAMLELRAYQVVVELGQRFEQRFPDSELLGSFQYMRALGLFWLGEYEQALDAARVVAEGATRDRRFAKYIMGQLHHAQGHAERALNWYRKVADDYPDAREAMEYFEKKSVGIEEVQVVRPGDPVHVTLEYRNIREANLQVYRVDLMKLFLREKNLSRITEIHLAGIAPLKERKITLGDGRDYRDLTHELTLDLEAEGAYLVIYRGDDLFTSGLVLITPLDIEVQTYPGIGRLRANVRNAVTGGYAPHIHVKAIATMSTEFREGDTDLRGIFVADELRGTPTVIAREGESRYAFHRGETWLGPRAEERPARHPSVDTVSTTDWQQNLRQYNVALQRREVEAFDNYRRAPQRNVQVKQAF